MYGLNPEFIGLRPFAILFRQLKYHEVHSQIDIFQDSNAGLNLLYELVRKGIAHNVKRTLFIRLEVDINIGIYHDERMNITLTQQIARIIIIP